MSEHLEVLCKEEQTLRGRITRRKFFSAGSVALAAFGTSQLVNTELKKKKCPPASLHVSRGVIAVCSFSLYHLLKNRITAEDIDQHRTVQDAIDEHWQQHPTMGTAQILERYGTKAGDIPAGLQRQIETPRRRRHLLKTLAAGCLEAAQWAAIHLLGK